MVFADEVVDDEIASAIKTVSAVDTDQVTFVHLLFTSSEFANEVSSERLRWHFLPNAFHLVMFAVS